MQFVVLATDKAGCVDLRQRTREQHRLYLRRCGADARVLLAGPTLEVVDGDMNGTLLVVEAESMEAVARFVADDPYSKAGLFESVEIRPWMGGLGRIDVSVPDPREGSVTAGAD